MTEPSRLEALRRRVLADPASIAFAALAEEYRRAGRLAECIDTATAGLEHHPDYASARVTLGRALMETGATEEAQRELELALASAPENLAALKSLAEVYRSGGNDLRARELAERGAALAPQDREWQALLQSVPRAAAPRSAGASERSEVRLPAFSGQKSDATPSLASSGPGAPRAAVASPPPAPLAPSPIEVSGPPLAGGPPLTYRSLEEHEAEPSGGLRSAPLPPAFPAPVPSSPGPPEVHVPVPGVPQGERADVTAPEGFEPLQRWLDAIVRERLRRSEPSHE
jgi:hypothetical protein